MTGPGTTSSNKPEPKPASTVGPTRATPSTNQPERDPALEGDRQRTRQAILNLARAQGAPTFHRVQPGGPQTVPDIHPLDGVIFSQRIQHAARRQLLSYIRAAREAEYTWHDIGNALGMPEATSTAARQAADTAAHNAFTYATSQPGSEHPRRYGRSTSWHCHSCDHAIADYGPDEAPADSEHGHARDCSRQAQLTARPAPARAIEWEAGQ